MTSSCTIFLSLTNQGLLINPMHPIVMRSSSKCTRSPGSHGMADTMKRSLSGALIVAVGAIDSFQPLASKSTLRNFTY